MELIKRLYHEDGEGGCCGHHHEGEGEHHCCGHHHEGEGEHHCDGHGHGHGGGCCGHHHEEEGVPVAGSRTEAMLMYMIQHNAQHALEIRDLEEGVDENAALLMEQAVKAMAISCDFLNDALEIIQTGTLSAASGAADEAETEEG